MVQVTQGLPNVAKEMNNFMFGQLGKGLGQAMSHYSAQGALQGVLGSPEYKKAQVPDKIQMLNEKMSRYGDAGQSLLATQLGIEQKAEQEKQRQSLAKYLGLDGDMSQDAMLDIYKTEAAIAKAQAQAAGKRQPETTFEKRRATQRADQISEIENNYLLAQGREGTYKSLEDLTNKLSGPNVNPYSEDAAQLEALGLAAIEPALKLFNPVGAIPTAKIQMIQKKFAPKFWDLTSTKKGKIKALRFINQKALEMGQRLQELQAIHGDDVPKSELLKLQNEGTRFVDALDQYNIDQIGKFGENVETKQLTPDLIQHYLKKANNNPDLAEQMAREDGVEW